MFSYIWSIVIDTVLTTKPATPTSEYGKYAADKVLMGLLKDKGSPIPENDIGIAALAKQHDLDLVSPDKHFEKIDNLKPTKW